MIGLEYSPFNFNIVFGFICALLGLFNYLKIGNIGKIVRLIGIGSGIIGFVLTLVYIIYSGIILTKDADDKTFINVMLIIKKKLIELLLNEDSFCHTYSDYGNIHLKYRSKDIYPKEEKIYKFIGLLQSSIYTYAQCKTINETDNLDDSKENYYETYANFTANKNEKGECDYLYYTSGSNVNHKRNIYDRWIITIILGCFIFILDIGFAIFGFLIFKHKGSSGCSISYINYYYIIGYV